MESFTLLILNKFYLILRRYWYLFVGVKKLRAGTECADYKLIEIPTNLFLEVF